MELKHRPYPELLLKMKEHFTTEENAEMVALITCAEYQHMTLVKICASKLWQQLPAVASEALTTVDVVAVKVLPKIVGVSDVEAQA
jgi:hypothetical protein